MIKARPIKTEDGLTIAVELLNDDKVRVRAAPKSAPIEPPACVLPPINTRPGQRHALRKRRWSVRGRFEASNESKRAWLV